jgi:tRNA-modifying protein YgfZ
MTLGRFVVLDDRGVLAVAGPDRAAFLQGLVSNDVAKVDAAHARHAALLTAQGRYLHDFMMMAAGETIWLETEAARLADLKRRLSLYRLRAKVALAERADLAVAVVFGAGVLKALDLPETAGAARPWSAGIVAVDPRLAALGARCVLPRAPLRERLAGLGFAEAGFAEYDRRRLELGVADGSRDLVPEKTILLEAGFDELNGVDWQKGCYIGQELTARTKYRGLLKRRLVPVRIDGAAPPPGAIVTAEGREAGEMRSSREGIGLALLRLEAVTAGAPLAAGEAVLQPQVPAWMRLEG